MSKLHLLNAFLTERLTAAAVEIFGAVEKTVSEYEEDIYRSKKEIERLQRLLTLDVVPKPEITLIRADDPQKPALPVPDEEFPPEHQRCEQEWIPNLGQYYSDPTQVKVEQEPFAISQEEEQLQGMVESDIREFIFTPPFVKSDCDLEPPQCLHQSQNGENRMGDSLYTNPYVEDIKLEPDGEGDQVFEPDALQPFYSMKSDRLAALSENREHFHIRRAALRAQSQRLKAPNQIHTGEKSHSCQMCSKCFLTEEYLLRHMQIHTGEKSCRCHVCYMLFTRKGHLAEHLRKLHPEQKQIHMQMSSSSKKRTARHRARINADPHAREQYLAKRRAYYQRRRAEGKKDYPPIESMSEAAKRERREQWRAAQKKCREKRKVLMDFAVGSSEDTLVAEKSPLMSKAPDKSPQLSSTT